MALARLKTLDLWKHSATGREVRSNETLRRQRVRLSPTNAAAGDSVDRAGRTATPHNSGSPALFRLALGSSLAGRRLLRGFTTEKYPRYWGAEQEECALAKSEAVCAFCEIVAGDNGADVVLDSETALAFLDRRPLFPGHCLLVPKHHYETLGDLPESLLAPLFHDAKLLARAVEIGLQAEGTFIAINNRVSQSVPHLHIHIVPRRRGDGLRGFFWPRHRYADAAEAEEVKALIRAALERLRSPEPGSLDADT